MHHDEVGCWVLGRCTFRGLQEIAGVDAGYVGGRMTRSLMNCRMLGGWHSAVGTELQVACETEWLTNDLMNLFGGKRKRTDRGWHAGTCAIDEFRRWVCFWHVCLTQAVFALDLRNVSWPRWPHSLRQSVCRCSSTRRDQYSRQSVPNLQNKSCYKDTACEQEGSAAPELG